MIDRHSAIKTWSKDEFPFEIPDDLNRLGEILPRGHWFAIEVTESNDTFVYLMVNHEVLE